MKTNERVSGLSAGKCCFLLTDNLQEATADISVLKFIFFFEEVMSTNDIYIM